MFDGIKAVWRDRRVHPIRVINSRPQSAQASSGLWTNEGASQSRYRNQRAWNRSRPGHEDLLVGNYERTTLRLEARDLYRNNEITRGAVERFVQYAIGKGIHPTPRTSDAAWNLEAKAWWQQMYERTCDYRQIPGVDLVEMQKLLIRHRILDGELAFLRLDNGQTQPIEAGLIVSPHNAPKSKNILEGVEVGKGGIVVAYHIAERANNNGGPDAKNTRRIKRENIIHCFQPWRIDQRRGVPDLAPAIAKLRDYDETDLYVLNKVKHDGQQLFTRNTEGGTANQTWRNHSHRSDSDGNDQQKVEKHEWGEVQNLKLGESFQPIESKTPNSNYVPYMKHELQTIASCLSIPYEFLMLIFTEGSYSSQRAAMLHAMREFTDWHDWVVNTYLTPLWNWRIAKAMKEGTIARAPVDNQGRSEWWQVTWTLPHFDWIDPEKQAKADASRYQMGQTSMSDIIASQGKERDQVFGAKADDIVRAQEIADAANARNPALKLTWKDIIDTAKSAAPAPAAPQAVAEPREDIGDEPKDMDDIDDIDADDDGQADNEGDDE